MTDNAEAVPEKRKKFCYVGAPAIFLLEQCCQHVNQAFGDFGCYLVGSAIERPDWRDVDVRFIMSDQKFGELFPDAYLSGAQWEFDARWLLINTSVAGWMAKVTGLPIDFQIQPQTFANEMHNKGRQALGMKLQSRRTGEVTE